MDNASLPVRLKGAKGLTPNTSFVVKLECKSLTAMALNS